MRHHAMNSRRLLLPFCAAWIFAVPFRCGAATPDAEDPIDVYFVEQFSYDDNLFRIPEGVSESDADVSIESRDDYINRASVGIQTQFDAARQVLELDLRFDDVRYLRNDDLNYRGGRGTLAWDWKLASNWSGRLNAQYDRSLASFSNYRLFVRDVVETASYGGEVRYSIGSRWAIFAGAAFADADHDAEIRQSSDFKSETGRGGVEFKTPAGNSAALEYRYTDARFPKTENLPDVSRKYQDQLPLLRLVYAFTVKTQLRARFGRLERDYVNPLLGDFSGSIWDATLRWEPREKLHFDIKGWHELTAYSDAESDYFISNGGSFSPIWEPTAKLRITAMYSHEEQEYIGDVLAISLAGPRRRDEVDTARIGIDFSPRDFLSLGLSWRRLERTSNRDLREYDDEVVMAQIRVSI